MDAIGACAGAIPGVELDVRRLSLVEIQGYSSSDRASCGQFDLLQPAWEPCTGARSGDGCRREALASGKIGCVLAWSLGEWVATLGAIPERQAQWKMQCRNAQCKFVA